MPFQKVGSGRSEVGIGYDRRENKGSANITYNEELGLAYSSLPIKALGPSYKPVGFAGIIEQAKAMASYKVNDFRAYQLQQALNSLPAEEDMFNMMRLALSDIHFDSNGKMEHNIPGPVKAWIQQQQGVNFKDLQAALNGEILDKVRQDALMLQFVPDLIDKAYAYLTESVVENVVREEQSKIQQRAFDFILAGAKDTVAVNNGSSANNFSNIADGLFSKNTGQQQSSRNSFNFSQTAQVGPFTVKLSSALSEKMSKADAIGSIIKIENVEEFQYRASVKAWDSLILSSTKQYSFGEAYVIDVIGRMADAANLQNIVYGLSTDDNSNYINSIKQLAAFDILLGTSQGANSANCLVIRNNSQASGQKFTAISTDAILNAIASIHPGMKGITITDNLNFNKDDKILNALNRITVAKVSVASGFFFSV